MKTLYLIVLTFFTHFISAQSIKGKIMDVLGKPIENVSVYINNSDQHTHSNEDGYFILKKIQIGDTLRFSHLVYQVPVHIIRDVDFADGLDIKMEDKAFELENVTVSSGRSALNTIARIDILRQPVNNAQELLRIVPGLIIGQHAGGGKAEQIFLRGFDCDHGTDINITVDGLPVNMVSHAHGQGYADLHFLMPETVESIDYGKGPYDTDKGNFTTAGHITFKTKERIDKNQFGMEVGQFNTLRSMAMFNLLGNENINQSAYIAGEYSLTDGPFESPQAFNRVNLFGKFTHKLNTIDKLTFTVSHLNSRWDASGQIPDRAVKNGSISRFGAIDDKEGGFTSRQNLSLAYQKYLSQGTFFKSNVYYVKSDFELYSNFTFFSRDSINGDQIKQKEDRSIYGVNVELLKEHNMASIDFSSKLSAGLRMDEVNDDELSHTKLRNQNLETISYGDVTETNVYATASSTAEWKAWMVNIGARLDHFRFSYRNQLAGQYNLLSDAKTLVSPKLTLQYDVSKSIQLYAKAGKGFHSNDTRVALAGQLKNSLPSAYGFDLGGVFKVHKNILLNAALWYLQLDQEFVYVGDEGIVEAGGRTQRKGLDVGLRIQPSSWLFIYSDVNLAKPRSTGEIEGNNLIPLAPNFTNTGGIAINPGKNFTLGLRYRHIGDRPANEDNSIVAKGYTVLDFNSTYQFGKIYFGLDVNNVLNTAWNETQFATASRLQNEANTIEEIHFTPGTPFMLKVKLGFRF